MTELVVFYPSQEVGEHCEALANEIHSLKRGMVSSAARIGEILNEVKEILPHGEWTKWLAYEFDWSEETSRKYRKLADYVKQNPRILGFRSIELAMAFPALPEQTQKEIIEKDVTRYSEAKEIIDKNDMQIWLDGIDDMMEIDPGKALVAIEDAMSISRLRPVAMSAMRKHAEALALLSDRDPKHMMQEAGMTTEEMYPAITKFQARIVDGDDNCQVVLWPDGIVLGIYPKQDDPIHLAYRNALMRFGLKGIRGK